MMENKMTTELFHAQLEENIVRNADERKRHQEELQAISRNYESSLDSIERMNDELRELVLNENVPIDLVVEFGNKLKALTAKAEELNSAIREARSFCVKLSCVVQMSLVLEDRAKAEEDFRNKAQKYVKKGGTGDEEK